MPHVSLARHTNLKRFTVLTECHDWSAFLTYYLKEGNVTVFNSWEQINYVISYIIVLKKYIYLHFIICNQLQH